MEQREKTILSGSKDLETDSQPAPEVAEAVETVCRQNNASKPEVALSEPEMAGQEPTEPEVGTAQSSSNEEKPVLASLSDDQPEAAKAETTRKQRAADAPKGIPETTSSDSKQPDRRETEGDAETEVLKPKPEVGDTTSGAGQRENAGSTANDSDNDEIAEILRRAPPPRILPHEEEEEEKEEEEEDKDRTEVVMRKTFTASINFGQEFVPITDELCPPPSAASPPPPPPPPLHRLQHPLPSSTAVKRNRSSSLDASSSSSFFSSSIAPPEAAEEVERGKGEEDRGLILSKAQNEARDLTSSLRHLQRLLENLSSFTELKIASFRPQATAVAVTMDTVARKDDEEAPSPSIPYLGVC